MNPLAEIKARIEENLRVLIVDDEPGIISALKREWRKEPFALVSFTNPSEALQAIQEQEISVILSDNLMPGMTGLELLAQVKRVTPDTRRLLLTGRTELSDAIRAFNEGVLHRFVTKPWEKEDLIAYIHEALDTYRAARLHSETGRLKDFALKQRSEQYKKALLELKQAQTQLALHEDRQDPQASWMSADLRKLRFLVVESHAGVREAIVETLTQGGVASCHAVSNGYDALNYLIGAVGVDVVLSDWDENELDGLTLFTAIRKIKTLTHQPSFILVTAEEDKTAVERAIETGVDGYILKPFRLESLLGRLKQIQRKARKAPPDGRLKALRNLTFLVASAALVNRAEIEGLLGEIGIQNLVLVNSGKHALRTLAERPVDVVFYDAALKDPDWAGLNETLPELDGRPSDPVIVVTSHDPKAKEIKAVRQAGLAHLSAPFHRADLSAAIIKAVLNE